MFIPIISGLQAIPSSNNKMTACTSHITEHEACAGKCAFDFLVQGMCDCTIVTKIHQQNFPENKISYIKASLPIRKYN